MARAALALALGTMAGAQALAAPSLGRLFLTPEERRAIDAAHVAGTAGHADEAAQRDAEATPRSVRVDGFMRRSAGASVIWVNGQPQQGPATTDARTRTVLDGDRVRIDSGDGRTRALRPGEQAPWR